MFRKLFGETETQQLNYLKPRFILVIVFVAVLLVGVVTHFMGIEPFSRTCMNISSLLYAVSAIVFGWHFLKSMFGFASLGALFSGNIVFGVVIMVVYFLLSAVLGLITLVLGIGRFIYLLVKKANQGLED